MQDVLSLFIVFSFLTLVCGGIYKLIRAKMDSTGIDEDTFDRLAKAFIKHKEDSNRRIQNLEAIINDDSSHSSTDKKIEEPKASIEIEEKEQRESGSKKNSSLRNMLHEE